MAANHGSVDERWGSKEGKMLRQKVRDYHPIFGSKLQT